MALAMIFQDRIGLGHSYLLGYTTMVLSFLLIFFGIRAYRDGVGNGTITFGRALGIGLAICVISSVCYVIAWEILYHFFMPDFMDKYGAYIIEKARASGANADALAAKAQEMQKYKVMYNNVLVSSALTFLEPLPVGLLITLISAVILRRKPQLTEAGPTMAVSN
jgi:small-conductance mechanosensitive channel